MGDQYPNSRGESCEDLGGKENVNNNAEKYGKGVSVEATVG
jgi:hypothetical protein